MTMMTNSDKDNNDNNDKDNNDNTDKDNNGNDIMAIRRQ